MVAHWLSGHERIVAKEFRFPVPRMRPPSQCPVRSVRGLVGVVALAPTERAAPSPSRRLVCANVTFAPSSVPISLMGDHLEVQILSLPKFQRNIS